MIRLTKETIDNIFEPRVEINAVHELRAGRLATDGKGHYFCIDRKRQWFMQSRQMPQEELVYSRSVGWKKGTWPVWIPASHAIAFDTLPARPLWEVLPGPCSQGEITVAFYRIAFPKWDDIVKIDGYPMVSYKTWSYVWEKFAAFDRRMFPEVMAGGAWALGCGFSADRENTGTTPDWHIDISPCKVAYAADPFYFTIHRSDYGEYSAFYPRRLWNQGLYDDMEETETKLRRRNSLAEAQKACEDAAGQPLEWSEVPALNSDGAYQSNIVVPQKKSIAA